MDGGAGGEALPLVLGDPRKARDDGEEELLAPRCARAAPVRAPGGEQGGMPAAQLAEERRAARKQRAQAAEVSTAGAFDVDGVRVLIETAQADPKGLPALADRLRGQLGETSVVVLGVPGEDRVSLVASATPKAVERGVRAGELVKAAAAVVGGVLGD